MQLEKYDVRTTENRNRFEFVSVGRSGAVLKVVEFIPLYEDGRIYNLGFGDINPVTGDWDNKAVTNNGDRNKILATVAALVVAFLDGHPTVTVYAEGSTPSRNRLYQRTIAGFWEEITESYAVKGYTESGDWVAFERGGPFTAFLIRHK